MGVGDGVGVGVGVGVGEVSGHLKHTLQDVITHSEQEVDGQEPVQLEDVLSGGQGYGQVSVRREEQVDISHIRDTQHTQKIIYIWAILLKIHFCVTSIITSIKCHGMV